LETDYQVLLWPLSQWLSAIKNTLLHWLKASYSEICCV
jgi:hypothetical protein